jgi:hypothetical protein
MRRSFLSFLFFILSCGFALAQAQYKVLWDFGGAGDGISPKGTLVADAAGNLYGTTLYGAPEAIAPTTAERSTNSVPRRTAGLRPSFIRFALRRTARMERSHGQGLFLTTQEIYMAPQSHGASRYSL